MSDQPGPGEKIETGNSGRGTRESISVRQDKQLKIIQTREMSPTASVRAIRKRFIFQGATYGFRSTPSIITTRFTPPWKFIQSFVVGKYLKLTV
jgi:hypothetical protein